MKYRDKYRSRLLAVNLLYVNQLIDVISQIIVQLTITDTRSTSSTASQKSTTEGKREEIWSDYISSASWLPVNLSHLSEVSHFASKPWDHWKCQNFDQTQSIIWTANKAAGGPVFDKNVRYTEKQSTRVKCKRTYATKGLKVSNLVFGWFFSVQLTIMSINPLGAITTWLLHHETLSSSEIS